MNLKTPLVILLLLLFITPLQAQEPEFLPVDQAFQPSAEVLNENPRQVEISWEIAEGYYLYQSRISI